MVSWSGIPGLSQIPILKSLFGSKDHTINDDELVFLVVPHVVRSQSLDQVNLRTIDTGPGGQTIALRPHPVASEFAPASASPALTPLPAGQGSSVNSPGPANPAEHGLPAARSFGVVQGQSAMA